MYIYIHIYIPSIQSRSKHRVWFTNYKKIKLTGVTFRTMACVLLGYVGGSVPKKGEGKKPFSVSRTQKICLFLFLKQTESFFCGKAR